MKIKSSNNFNYKVRYRTSNITNFINNCKAKNIEIKSVEKESAKEVVFEVNGKGLGILKTCDFFNKENMTFSRFGGRKKILNFIVLRIGLLIGFIVSFLCIMFFQNKLFYIKINGIPVGLQIDVKKSINDFGIGFMSYIGIEMTKLEEYLTKTHNFSLVSIVAKGNTLILNIKQSFAFTVNIFGITKHNCQYIWNN